VKRKIYPPEFIVALLETAERANIEDDGAARVMARILEINAKAPQLAEASEMQGLVSKLCWLISEADGWFYGPGTQY
jgi:hypothetical protein